LTESQWTSQFLKKLRAALPEAVALKHNDIATGGIPDFSVTHFEGGPYARTTWVEVKIIGAPSVMFKPLQVEMLKRLGGWYLVYSPKLRRCWLFRADEREKWSEGSQMTVAETVERISRFF
jgi:hypothetical protein